MAYKISTECVNCGACLPECPVGAISEDNAQHIIDANLCVDCGSCEGVCPSGAIAQE